MPNEVLVIESDQELRRALPCLNFTIACWLAIVGGLAIGVSNWPAGRGVVIVALVQLLLWITLYGKTSSTARWAIAASGALMFLVPLPAILLADMGFGEVPAGIVWGTLYVSASYLAYAAFGVVTRRVAKVVYPGQGPVTGARRANPPSSETPFADTLMTDVSPLDNPLGFPGSF